MHLLHRLVRGDTLSLIVGNLVRNICADDAEHAAKRLELERGDAVRFLYEIDKGFCQRFVEDKGDLP